MRKMLGLNYLRQQMSFMKERKAGIMDKMSCLCLSLSPNRYSRIMPIPSLKFVSTYSIATLYFKNRLIKRLEKRMIKKSQP